MRVQLTREVIRGLVELREEGALLRQAIEALRQNPTPPDALPVLGRPGRYEQHVPVGNRGYWLIWRVGQDRGETVVT